MVWILAMVDNVVREQGCRQQNQRARENWNENELGAYRSLNTDERCRSPGRMRRVSQVHHQEREPNTRGDRQWRRSEEGDDQDRDAGTHDMSADEVAGLGQGRIRCAKEEDRGCSKGSDQQRIPDQVRDEEDREDAERATEKTPEGILR